ncbi:MAG: hypothetical protein HY360_24025 [Verrucomicrobia bacterium]|nr:hypothetical protein [Verrucomicrobiota bacterium]
MIPTLAAAPAIDGDLNDPVWKEAATLAPFQPYGVTAAPIQQTEVKIGCADESLLVAFRCKEEKPGQLRRLSNKRDTDQWEDDSVEVFLDVQGTRVEEFLFLVTAANSQYDARNRWPANAEVEQHDVTWNAEWTSAVRVDEKAKEWTAEIRIPFKTIGVPSPNAASKWAVNFARTRNPVLKELSIWSFSPKRGFGNPEALVTAAFGKEGVGRSFAGAAAPRLEAEIASTTEATLIPFIRKEIKPDQLDGVAVRPAAEKGEIPILISRPKGISKLASWPVRCGVPFPRGALPDARNVRLLGPDGKAVPFQSKTLGTWDLPAPPRQAGSGKSVRWLLIAFDAGTAERCALQFGSKVEAARADPKQPVRVKDDKKTITVETGDLKLQVSRERNSLIEQLWWKGIPLFRKDGRRGAWFTDSSGKSFEAAKDAKDYRVAVEQSGPLHAVIKLDSMFADETGQRSNQSVTRLYLAAGQPMVQIHHTFVLTDGGKKRQFKNFSVSFPLEKAARDVKRRAAEPIAYDSFEEGLRKSMDITGETFSVAQFGHRKAAILDGDKPIAAQGECAGGWVDLIGKKTGLALVARWFSQLYPDEIELTAGGELTYHFWSPRFPQAMDLRPKPWLTARGNYEIWHSQNVPFIQQCKRMHQLPVEDGGTMDADGTGIAKTHEFALILHDPNQESLVAEQALAIQDPIYAYADPAWTTTTEVFQRSLPAGDPSFKDVDDALERYTRRFIADQRDDKIIDNKAYGPSLGIFDFGDDLHQNKYCHRYYTGHFYCAPTMPWCLYFRSGDRQARRLAEANSRHRMDVDMCHFTADPSSGWRAGAWNDDDSGIIHWAVCSCPLETTSNYGPHLAWMYYLTGDERAYDVALEVTDALKWAAKRAMPAYSHRASGMSLWNVTELWNLTGDPELKKICDHLADLHVKNVRKGLAIGYYPEHPSDFTLAYAGPAMIRYHTLTGDPKVANWIVNQAAHLAEVQRVGGGGSFSFYDLLAYAHQLTGEPRYLDAAWLDLRGIVDELRVTGDDVFDKVRSFIGTRVWWMYQTPMLLASVKAAGDIKDPLIHGNALLTQGDILALNEDGKPFQINVAVGDGANDDAALDAALKAGDLAVVLRNPRGETVARSPYPRGRNLDKWFFYGGWIARLADTEKPMKGVYRVEVQSKVPNFKLALKPLDCTSAKVMSRVVPDGESNLGRRYYVMPAAGAKEFGFKTELNGKMLYYQNPPSQGAILNPEGKTVATLDYRNKNSEIWQTTRTNQWISLTAAISDGDNGKVWQLQIPPYLPTPKLELIGAPPYVAATAESCFNAPADSQTGTGGKP